MIDYDREAASYDETRGGDARAKAAAEAVEQLPTDAPERIAEVTGLSEIGGTTFAGAGQGGVPRGEGGALTLT